MARTTTQSLSLDPALVTRSIRSRTTTSIAEPSRITSMEISVDAQTLHPIRNEVEVLNGSAFRDVVLQPRIKPLLEVTTFKSLLDVLGPVRDSLETFGTEPRLEITKSALNNRDPEVINTKTIVDLTHMRPPHAVSLTSRTTTELFGINGAWKIANQLGLGDLLELKFGHQPKPYALASGLASATIPLPIGRGTVQFAGFFFNEDRTWSSYSLATHGISGQLRVPWFAGLQFKAGAKAVARNVHSIGDGAGDTVRAAAGSSSLKVSAISQLAHTGPFHNAKVFVEAAGKPGDTQHVKALGHINCEFPVVPGEELWASFRGNVGYLHTEDDKPRLCDNFLIGGQDSLLGYKRNCVGPRSGSDFTGGQAFYTSRLAVKSKLPFKPLSPLRLTALVDAGVLRVNSSARSVQQNISDLFNDSTVVSTAAGLTYQTKKASFNALYVIPLRGGDAGYQEPGLNVSAELTLA